MHIKCLIFDFGFTLFYFKDASVEKYFECFQKGLKKSVSLLERNEIIKDKTTAKTFVNLFNKKRQGFWKESIQTKKEFLTSFIFKTILESMVEKEQISEISNFSSRLYEDLAIEYHSEEEKEWKPFEHTKPTLEKLKQKGIKLAVLSNHPHHKMIENLLKKHYLEEYFEAIVTSAEFGRRKPDPEIIFYTIEKMDLKEYDTSECLICGDEYADIMGGHRAGIKTALCERVVKFPVEKDINVPNVIKIKDISDLIELIT